MSEILTKPTWIPYYIQRMKGSSAWLLPDYQFCWYWKLLTESADSDIPGYLPGSTDKLWRLAGAKSQSYFEKWGGCELVSRFFRRTEIEGQAWIYNEKMLGVLHEQGKKLTKKRKRCLSSLLSVVQGLPDWIPEEEFRSYMEMRDKIHKPLTAHAIKLLVGKLEKLREAGDEPKQVLNEATLNCWHSVWPLRQEAHNGTNGSGTTKPHQGDFAEAQCSTCGGSGWDLTSGKAVRCECFNKNRAVHTASGAKA